MNHNYSKLPLNPYVAPYEVKSIKVVDLTKLVNTNVCGVVSDVGAGNTVSGDDDEEVKSADSFSFLSCSSVMSNENDCFYDINKVVIEEVDITDEQVVKQVDIPRDRCLFTEPDVITFYKIKSRDEIFCDEDRPLSLVNPGLIEKILTKPNENLRDGLGKKDELFVNEGSSEDEMDSFLHVSNNDFINGKNESVSKSFSSHISSSPSTPNVIRSIPDVGKRFDIRQCFICGVQGHIAKYCKGTNDVNMFASKSSVDPKMKAPLVVKPVVAKSEDASTSTSSLVSMVKVPKIQRKKNHRKQKKPTEHINLIDFVSRALVDHKKYTVTSYVPKFRKYTRATTHVFPKFEKHSVKTTAFVQRNAQNSY